MNSMPFRQLKSFFKILIGVQYHLLLFIERCPYRGSIFPLLVIFRKKSNGWEPRH